LSGTDHFDLDAYLEGERSRVEEALCRAVDRLARLVPDDVGDAVRHGVMGGGKRIRPILCVTAYRACVGPGAEIEEAALYDFAAAIELVHAYSLMHDDLPCMDDAPLRRGRPSAHREFGEEVTMRAGLVLIPGAAHQAWRALDRLGCSRGVAAEAVRSLMEAAGAGGMVGGQWLDLEGEGRVLSEADLDELHRRKTGALLAASLVMGATAAGADGPVAESLRTYGRAVGLSFQIVDDILDATESAAVLGKNPSDAALGKSTYVALHGLAGARERAAAEAEAARAALAEAGVRAPALDALAGWIVERRS